MRRGTSLKRACLCVAVVKSWQGSRCHAAQEWAAQQAVEGAVGLGARMKRMAQQRDGYSLKAVQGAIAVANQARQSVSTGLQRERFAEELTTKLGFVEGTAEVLMVEALLSQVRPLLVVTVELPALQGKLRQEVESTLRSWKHGGCVISGVRAWCVDVWPHEQQRRPIQLFP